MKTYRLALLTGWRWQKLVLTPEDEFYQHINNNNFSHIKDMDGNIIVQRFCLPDGTPIQSWQSLALKIDPPVRWILFWPFLKLASAAKD